jgi:O-antigen/teichoic acid export membrane protein
MFVGLVMPIMSQAAKNDLVKFKEVMEKTLNALVIVLVPMIAFTFLLSDKIVYTIGGKNFPQSAYVLNILIVATAMIFLATLWSNAIIALGSQRYLAKVYFFGAVVSLIINIPLIYFFSYNGAAWGTLVTESFVTILMAFRLQKIIAYTPSTLRIFRIVGAAIISSILIILAGNEIVLESPIVEMSVQLLLGSVSYFIALFMLNGVSMEEMGLFFKK